VITRRALLAGAAAIPLLPRKAAMASATSPALFVAAHPDDEILAMGVALAEHLAAGQDVHVLWLTDGTASGVINMLNGTGTTASSWWGEPHDPAAEGYSPLSPADLGAARIAEAKAAVNCLLSGTSGRLTLHRAGLQDGQVTQADAQTAIVDLADEVAPGAPVRVKTHTWLVDHHPDHIAAGKAAKALAAQARFSDLRHYVEQPYWSDSRLSQVSTSWDTPASSNISTRVRNACRAYGSWHPPASYAIGYHSVAAEFGVVSSKLKCLVHP
jgi:LmbE family N-acetylglucosaminyl deacetylase